MVRGESRMDPVRNILGKKCVKCDAEMEDDAWETTCAFCTKRTPEQRGEDQMEDRLRRIM